MESADYLDDIVATVHRDMESHLGRGKVADLFEKKGHKFVDLDLLWLAQDERPLMHARHTAIYEPRRGRG